MRFVKSLGIFKMFYPSLVWRMPKKEEKCVYLTFDDGPHPTITPQVLDILRDYNVKATFFCVGNNVRKFPETFEMVKKAGHSIGCHTYNHENGWKTRTDDYVNSVIEANKLINSNLIRPPHGKIKHSQLKKLKKIYANGIDGKPLKFVAWTVIAYDWDHDLSPEQVYQNVVKNVSDGAIIVFHDSEKAYQNMISALPKVLEFLKRHDFKSLDFRF